MRKYDFTPAQKEALNKLVSVEYYQNVNKWDMAEKQYKKMVALENEIDAARGREGFEEAAGAGVPL